jgi:hypothetical protein
MSMTFCEAKKVQPKLKEKIKLNSQSIAAKPKYLDKRLYGHK